MKTLVVAFGFLFPFFAFAIDPTTVTLKCLGTGILDGEFRVLALKAELQIFIAPERRLVYFEVEVANNGFHDVRKHTWSSTPDRFFVEEGGEWVSRLNEGHAERTTLRSPVLLSEIGSNDRIHLSITRPYVHYPKSVAEYELYCSR